MALRTSTQKVILNGLKMGYEVPQGQGAFIAVETVSGLGGPAPTFVTGQRVQGNGLWATKSYLGGRALGITGFVIADTPSEASAAADAIIQAASVDDIPVTFIRSDRALYAMTRRNGEVVIDWTNETQFDFQLVLLCTNPDFWDADPQTGLPRIAASFLIRLPASSGGLTFPVTFPITFTGSTGTGDASVAFSGGGGVPYLNNIIGPVVNPKLIFTNDAGTFTLAWNLELLSGQYLSIDLIAHTAKLNGQVNHPPSIRQWPTFPAGTTVIQFRADQYNTDAYTNFIFLQKAN